MVSLTRLIALATFLLVPAACWAIGFPQADSFQDGTTRDWTNDADTAVTNQAGGPGGMADKFLQVSSGTFGDATNLRTERGIRRSQTPGRKFGPQGIARVIAYR